MRRILFTFLSLSLLTMTSTGWAKNNQSALDFDIHEFTLDNGLRVILHQDSSMPVVSLMTLVHVGSSREVTGKTGFAHFFEHMSFQNSENVPKGANRRYIGELGGYRNGSTWSDGTNYYEVVPKDVFEKLLWIDSDRLGYMINTVSKKELENEIQVVKNEKRQRYDNKPYGHKFTIISKHLAPKGHPYSWTTIGELEDLQNATIDDVKKFYKKYYGPDNAVFAVVGDIDIPYAKKLVKKWFGDIKKGEKVDKLKPTLITLKKDKNLYYEDQFAKIPDLTIAIPTIHQTHPDATALEALGILLGSSSSPLIKEIVDEKKLASNIYSYSYSREMSGSFMIGARGFAGGSLDEMYKAINLALDKFAKNGVSKEELQGVTNSMEVSTMKSLKSTLGKARTFAMGRVFYDDPKFYLSSLNQYKSLKPKDIMNVFKKYVYKKNSLRLSIVPKGEGKLALKGAKLVKIKEEKIVNNKNEKKAVKEEKVTYKKTPASFSRAEPESSDDFAFKLPKYGQLSLKNGIDVNYFQDKKIPMVDFQILFRGGDFLNPDKMPGVANFLTQVWDEGSEKKSKAEFEAALRLLGSSISFKHSRKGLIISGSTLKKNLDKTLELVEEVLWYPNLSNNVIAKIQKNQINKLKSEKAFAEDVADSVLNRLLYEEGHPLWNNPLGTEESVGKIDKKVLINHVNRIVKSNLIKFSFSGDVNDSSIKKVIDGEWLRLQKGSAISFETKFAKKSFHPNKVYFVDMPKAKQSVLRGFIPSVAGDQKDFDAIKFANQRFGRGMNARLMQTLRLKRGYTYGVGSWLSRNEFVTPWMLETNVRSNATLESLQDIQRLLKEYPASYNDYDLKVSKNVLIKRLAVDFDRGPRRGSTDPKFFMLGQMHIFSEVAEDFEKRQDKLLKLTRKEVQEIAKKYMAQDKISYVVVGDKKTQFDRLEKLGLGKPILINHDGKLN